MTIALAAARKLLRARFALPAPSMIPLILVTTTWLGLGLRVISCGRRTGRLRLRPRGCPSDERMATLYAHHTLASYVRLQRMKSPSVLKPEQDSAYLQLKARRPGCDCAAFAVDRDRVGRGILGANAHRGIDFPIDSHRA